MEKYVINKETLVNIANAVRSKESTEAQIPVSSLAARINALDTTGIKIQGTEKNVKALEDIEAGKFVTYQETVDYTKYNQINFKLESKELVKTAYNPISAYPIDSTHILIIYYSYSSNTWNFGVYDNNFILLTQKLAVSGYRFSQQEFCWSYSNIIEIQPTYYIWIGTTNSGCELFLIHYDGESFTISHQVQTSSKQQGFLRLRAINNTTFYYGNYNSSENYNIYKYKLKNDFVDSSEPFQYIITFSKAYRSGKLLDNMIWDPKTQLFYLFSYTHRDSYSWDRYHITLDENGNVMSSNGIPVLPSGFSLNSSKYTYIDSDAEMLDDDRILIVFSDTSSAEKGDVAIYSISKGAFIMDTRYTNLTAGTPERIILLDNTHFLLFGQDTANQNKLTYYLGTIGSKNITLSDKVAINDININNGYPYQFTGIVKWNNDICILYPSYIDSEKSSINAMIINIGEEKNGILNLTPSSTIYGINKETVLTNNMAKVIVPTEGVS